MSLCTKFHKFCYICGKCTIMPSKRAITSDISELYQQYFNQTVINDVDWAPKIVCTSCVSRLSEWKKGEIESMPFGIPVMWTNPQVHDPDNCYACINDIIGLNRAKKRKVELKGTQFVQLPVPHSDNVPIPKRLSPTEEYIPPTFDTVGESSASLYVPSNVTLPCNHVEITQSGLDKMIRRLKLSQRQSILLAQDLKKANILAPDVKIYAAIGRHHNFTAFFKAIEDNSLAYCTDIKGLVLTMHNEYNPEDWRLFIDSSKSSLKAVLLYATNNKKSVPIALSTNTKENYASLKKILDLVKYQDNRWKICADLKVISLLRGMQTGYTKNMCFMCLWNTRFNGDQYTKKDWPLREGFRLRHGNIVEVPLVPVEKILLPPLHIKLGLVKNFIKALNPESNAFNELKRIFPRLSGMKIKEGILNGPDIRRLMKDERFEASLSDLELVAWDCLKAVIENVLGIHRDENWRIHIQNMLDAFHNINVRMSLKIHFLHCHMDKFAEQSPSESDEHGERFHQVTANLEHWYSGKKLDALLGDICWNLQADDDEEETD